MLCCTPAILAAAAPDAAPERNRGARRTIAVLGLAGSALDADTARLVEEMIVASLDSTGRFKVTSPNDLVAVLGFERQKQSLGCEESAACLAEIAGALGVEFVAAARVGKLENLTVLMLAIIDVKNAAAVARSRRTLGSVKEFPAAIDAMVAEAVAGIGPAFGSRLSAFGTAVGGAAAAHLSTELGTSETPASGAPRAAAEPALPKAESRKSKAGFWLASGAAVWFASSAMSETKSRDSTLSRGEYARASTAAENAVFRSNVAWGVAGTAALAAGVFVAFPF